MRATMAMSGEATFKVDLWSMYARYYLKATMVRDWKWDYDVKHHITVNAELDLNAFPEAALGGRNQDHKNLCCLCCKLVSAVIIIHSITFWTNYERRKSKRGRLIKCKNAKKTSIVKQYQIFFFHFRCKCYFAIKIHHHYQWHHNPHHCYHVS